MRVLQAPSESVVSPVIDAVEARWAAEAVASLARQLDGDSVVALVLTQAYRELNSLVASAEPDVIGPIRMRMVA